MNLIYFINLGIFLPVSMKKSIKDKGYISMIKVHLGVAHEISVYICLSF